MKIQETWSEPQIVESGLERKIRVTLALHGDGWNAQNGVNVLLGPEPDAVLVATQAAKLLLTEWAGTVVAAHVGN